MKKIVFVCLSLVYVSCISTHALLIDPSMDSLPEVDPTNVRIILDESDLEGLDYVKVAMIESTASTSGGPWTSQTKIIESMRKKAGELGANAILMPSINEPGAEAKVAGEYLGTGAERRGNVIAIFIKDPQE